MDAGPSSFNAAAVTAGGETPTLDAVIDIVCAQDPCPLSLKDKNSLRATCRDLRAVVNATVHSAKVEWDCYFDEFCEWKLVPQLKRLHVPSGYHEGTKDTPEQARLLAMAPWAALECLDIKMDCPEGFLALCSSEPFNSLSSLRELRVIWNYLHEKTVLTRWVQALPQGLLAARWPNIKLLEVNSDYAYGEASDGDPSLLVEALHFPSLSHLLVESSLIEQEAVSLADTTLPHLTSLQLSKFSPLARYYEGKTTPPMSPSVLTTLDACLPPQLLSLSLANLNIPKTPLHNLCGALTFLSLNLCHAEDASTGRWLRAMLDGAGHLQGLELSGIDFKSFSDFRGCRLQELRMLKAGFAWSATPDEHVQNNGELNAILEADFPNLVSLSIDEHGNSRRTNPLPEILPGAGRRLLPSLKELNINSLNIDKFNRKDIVPILSQITRLTLKSTHAREDNYLSWLAYDCPCLIECTIPFIQSFPWNPLPPGAINPFLNAIFSNPGLPALRHLKILAFGVEHEEGSYPEGLNLAYEYEWNSVAPELLDTKAVPLPSLQELTCRAMKLGPDVESFLKAKFPRLELNLVEWENPPHDD